MPGRDVSILLVEDHPGDARLIKGFLGETEFAEAPLQRCTTLMEALTARLDPAQPQCALIDLSLPDACGVRVLQEVQRVHPSCAVIALIGMEEEGLARAALQGGAQGFLEKSRLSADELGRSIRTAIERHDFLLRIRAADRAVYQRELRLRALLEHSSDLTIVMDAEGSVTYLSPTAARLLLGAKGTKSPEIAALFDPADRKRLRTALERSRAAKGQAVPLTVRAKSRIQDRPIWLEGTIIDLSHEEEVGAVVLNLHDITARHEMTEALKDLNANLERRVESRTLELRRMEADLRVALTAEQEINEMRRRFVSMASHEFRTPLGGILGSAELIECYVGQEPERVAKHVSRIKHCVRDLTAILQDFLSLEKLDKGLEEVVPEQFCVREFTRELIDELHVGLRPGQQIVQEHTGQPDLITADRRLLAIVLRNLLSNAIKYSPVGKPIQFKTKVQAGWMAVQVIDRGIGVPRADQGKLFDPFFRAGNSTGVQGTGLGLHIVRRYVELMGGEIHFESAEGEGSTFNVEIPLVRAPVEELAWHEPA